jgi:hypothetical protein
MTFVLHFPKVNLGPNALQNIKKLGNQWQRDSVWRLCAAAAAAM